MKVNFCFFKNGIGGELSPSFFSKLRDMSSASVLIETGTYFGNTVESMRHVFSRVFSIELSSELYKKAVERFKTADGVKILNGDSANKLGEALSEAGDDTSILWLDAHYSGEGTSRGQENTPIIREIEIVDQKGNGKEVVLIDDIRMFGRVPNGFLTHEAVSGYPDLAVVVEILGRCKQRFESFIVGDMLIALPNNLKGKYEVSEVVKAATQLRLGGRDKGATQQLERIIAHSLGEEKETFLALPDIFQQQLLYGLGGDYCYWRGLIYEAQGQLDLASADFDLARRCGVPGAVR